MATSHNDKITWLGHATCVIDIDGMRIVTDPLLTHRLIHLRRHQVLEKDAASAADLILISHLHLDHLHLPSLKTFDRNTKVVVPTGGAKLLRNKAFENVVEATAGDSITHNGIKIDVVHAEHKHTRLPASRHRAQSVGYVIRSSAGSVYFAGDTDLFNEMKNLEADVALLPIGGWSSYLGSGHLNPARAVEATKLIEPKVVIPIHWGTYAPLSLRKLPPKWLNRPADEFRDELKEAGLLGKARILKPGESYQAEIKSPAPSK